MNALIAIIASSLAQIVSAFKKKETKPEPVETVDNVTPIKNPAPKPTPDLPIEFKTDRIKQEFEQLKTENSKLRALLVHLNEVVNARFEKNLTLTHIFRTQEQQDSFYKDSEKYKKRKFKSPHQFWHGADIRSRTFTSEEIAWIEDYLNGKYNTKNYYKWTAKCHNVGLGDHFHLQYIEA